jgi:hypothetical protein
MAVLQLLLRQDDLLLLMLIPKDNLGHPRLVEVLGLVVDVGNPRVVQPLNLNVVIY